MSSEIQSEGVKFPEKKEAAAAEVVDEWERGTAELKLHLQVAQRMIKKRKRGLSQIIRAMNREEDGCEEDDGWESYDDDEEDDGDDQEDNGGEPPEPASVYHQKYGISAAKLQALIQEIKSVESLVKDLKATADDPSDNDDGCMPR